MIIIKLRLLTQMETYSSETRHAFEGSLDWLNQWACARRFGLGSRMPWDQQFLVESLSDSTIYMSYYTVSHLLHCAYSRSFVLFCFYWSDLDIYIGWVGTP